MSDYVTGEMVETAARATYEDHGLTSWDEEGQAYLGLWRNDARSALEAVAPLIAAKALRAAADRLAETIEDADEADEFAYGYQGGKALAHMFLKTEARRIEQEDRNG